MCAPTRANRHQEHVGGVGSVDGGWRVVVVVVACIMCVCFVLSRTAFLFFCCVVTIFDGGHHGCRDVHVCVCVLRWCCRLCLLVWWFLF